ncbi:unnamed protein product [Hymenolepis diminuta]|uniref:Uncharacterized protein n=1 Tax=Hymenolepis diminuta TaxID=6216 RepID=A0A564YHF4_HYMDI|nr:unnamed protein product [Hymenolepis diminuta]
MYEGVVGPSTDQSPKTSINGQGAASFCANNGLKMLNTYYEKKKALRSTWQHPHVTRKAEANSDYYLVVTTLRVKACTRRTIFRPNRRLQVWQLSSDVDLIAKRKEHCKVLLRTHSRRREKKKWHENVGSILQSGLQKKVRLRIKWLKMQKAEAYRRQRNDMVRQIRSAKQKYLEDQIEKFPSQMAANETKRRLWC